MANSQIDIKRLSFPNADAQLLLGLKGDKGDTGDKGDKGDTGDTGNGIASITHTGTSGAVKTYTITFTDGTSQTFDVTDGQVTTEQMDTAIDNAVTDVKSDLNNISGNISGEIIPTLCHDRYIDLGTGKIVATNGESAFFNVIKGLKYKWSATNSNRTAAGFFASVPTIGATSYNSSGINIQQNTEFVAPIDGYCYIYFNNATDSSVSNSFAVDVYSVMENINDTKAAFPKIYIAASENISGEIAPTLCHDRYINESGRIVSLACESAYFPIVKGLKYKWNASGNNRYTIGYFDTIPQIGATTYDSAPHYINPNTEFVAPIDGFCFIYFYNQVDASVSASFSVDVYSILESLDDLHEEVNDLSFSVYSNIVNVKKYGALGDGETDDSLAVRLALNACTDGDILYFPKGTYCLNNVELKSNLTVVGDGWDSIIYHNDNVAGNCFAIYEVSNITVKNIACNGNRSNNSSPAPSADSIQNCFWIKDSNNIILDNVYGYNAGYHGVIMVNVQDITIKNSKFENNGFRPIHAHDIAKNIFIYNNRCVNNGKGFIEAGESVGGYDGIFLFSNISNATIENNIVEANTVNCIEVGGNINLTQDGGSSENIKIINNTIKPLVNTIEGINLRGADLSNVIVEGNFCNGGKDGIVVAKFSQADQHENVNTKITILNNTVKNTTSTGIRIFHNAKGIVLSNNVIDNITNSGSIGIYCVDSNELMLSGNRVYDAETGTRLSNCNSSVLYANSFLKSRNDSIMTISMVAESSCSNVQALSNILSYAPSNNSVNGVTLNNIIDL